MEQKPDTENVLYMDEYPHLSDRVYLRRMGQLALEVDKPGELLLFPIIEGEPDGAA